MMDFHLFRLHRRLPSAFQAVLAPLQTLHWRVLERRLQSRGTTSLEAIVRPALLPTEQWSDLEDWRSNLRLIAWLRAAHLRAKPRVQEQLPAARAEIRARLVDSTLPPPSMAKCRELFGLTYPSGGARQPGLPRAAARAGAPKPTTQQRTGSTRDVPFEAVLEASGGLVAHRGAWAAFAEEHGMYELVSRELVEALAAYIVARAPSLCASDGSDMLRILECGAGNGELSHHIRQALVASRVKATLMANDNGSWPLPDGLQFEGVQPISYRAALRQHAPHLVLSSWMPMGVDWTADFRACPAVQEYLLLGEVYDGACGHNFATWGNPAYAPLGRANEPPPYKADGWAVHEVPEVARWQLSRFASDASDDCERNSHCVSFRRER